MKFCMKEIKKLPDAINKEQFREVCHISKRTASFYLQSGLLPCHNTGKMTRCYTIKRKDLIQFLNDLQENPARYSLPQNWYKGSNYSRKAPITSSYFVLTPERSKMLSRYYDDKLSRYPDVMDAKEAQEVIGYAQRTIKNWCREGYIKSLTTYPRHLIPKVFLKEFLISERYNDILRKSDKHMQTLADFKCSKYADELLATYL